AAEAQAGAARKARMPKVVFQAEGGVVADDTADLGDTDFRQWNAGVRVNQSLWSGGRMAAESGYADRLLEQASIEYGQVVNQAFFEVEQGLVADRLLADKADAVAASVEHAVAAEQLAWEQYGSGLVDIITALEAHRRALSAREGMIEVRKERMISRINLLLALGGSLFRENSESSGGDDR
ncbi:MAG TPA: TolC family protein, partial [Opitutales bacterium]|nr:TolC family protein [Opitutales bacterium]